MERSGIHHLKQEIRFNLTNNGHTNIMFAMGSIQHCLCSICATEFGSEGPKVGNER